jgi:hypothetical protein
MTLPRKGSHTTVVDGKSFRYTTRGSMSQGYYLVTIQEEAPKPGRPIRAKVRGGALFDEPDPNRITGIVAAVVRDAKKAGWNPSGRVTLPQFEFEY